MIPIELRDAGAVGLIIIGMYIAFKCVNEVRCIVRDYRSPDKTSENTFRTPIQNIVLDIVKRLEKKIDTEAEQIRDIHKIHDKVDDDGIPLVYVPRSFETALTSLEKAINRLANLQEDLKRSVDTQVAIQTKLLEQFTIWNKQSKINK